MRVRGLLINARCCGDATRGGASELLLREYIFGGGIRDPRLFPWGAEGISGRDNGGAGEVSEWGR